MERRYLFIFECLVFELCDGFVSYCNERQCMLCKNTSPVGLFLLFLFCLPVTKRPQWPDISHTWETFEKSAFQPSPPPMVTLPRNITFGRSVAKNVADGRKASAVLSANFEAHVTPLFSLLLPERFKT